MANARLRVAILLMPLVLVGCASGPVGSMPQYDAQNAATIHVIREASVVGFANAYRIAVDGKEIFDIRSGQDAAFNVSLGVHRVEVKCFGGFIPTTHVDGGNFDIAKGRENYFIVSPSLGCATLKPVDELHAKSLLNNSSALKLPG